MFCVSEPLFSQQHEQGNHVLLSSFRQKVKPLIQDLDSSSLARARAGVSMFEVLKHENTLKLQSTLEQTLLELSPVLVKLNSCFASNCESRDSNQDLSRIARTMIAVAGYLSEDRVLANRRLLLELGYLLERSLKLAHRPILTNAEHAQVLRALIRLTDRFPIDFDLLAIRDQALQLSQASLTAAPEQALVLEVLIALYQATAEARWLLEAEKLVDKILHISGVSPCNKTACISALPLALSTLDLHHLTGDLSYKQYSLHVLDAVLTEVATIDPLFAVEAYVLYQRVHAKPFHMTVVGLKADPAAQQLFTLARAAPVAYRRLEWWDRTQGTLPNPDVRYPILKRAAAFICVEHHCSLPLFSEADMRHALLRIFNKS